MNFVCFQLFIDTTLQTEILPMTGEVNPQGLDKYIFFYITNI